SNHRTVAHTGYRLCLLGGIGDYREFWQRVERLVRFHARLPRKEFAQPWPEGVERFRQALEPSRAAFRRQFPCFVQQTREGDQLLPGQLHGGAIGALSWAAAGREGN